MDLKHLYQDIIIDHNKAPHNFRRIDPPTHKAEGYNPLCGDKLVVYLMMNGDTIEDVSFEGSGCAISVASASLMTDYLKGKSREDAEKLFHSMHDLLTGEGEEPDIEALGKLAALSGVKDYPTRVKCATLCWHTVNAAMHDESRVSTE